MNEAALSGTTPEMRTDLRAGGFVSVGGLRSLDPERRQPYIIKHHPDYEGKRGLSHGVQVIYTCGEVWIAARLVSNLEASRKVANQFEFLGDIPVPCSRNGEGIDVRDILDRISDPDWKPDHPDYYDGIAEEDR